MKKATEKYTKLTLIFFFSQILHVLAFFVGYVINYRKLNLIYAENSEELSATPTSTEPTQTDEAIAALERNGVSFTNTATRGKTKKGKPKMAMRIDIPNTTPTRTITAVTSMLWEDLVNNPKKEGHGEFINRKKIQCAEKMIRGAFVELYRGLGLL